MGTRFDRKHSALRSSASAIFSEITLCVAMRMLRRAAIELNEPSLSVVIRNKLLDIARVVEQTHSDVRGSNGGSKRCATRR
jgi:hypothetical protein